MRPAGNQQRSCTLEARSPCFGNSLDTCYSPAQTADLGDAGLVLKPFHLSLDVFHGSAQAIDRRLGWDAIAVAGTSLR